MSEHTPTPWRWVTSYPAKDAPEVTILGDDDRTVVAHLCSEEREANATYILRAVNHHARLLAALEPLANLWHDTLDERAGGDEAPVFALNEKAITIGDIREAQAAIAEAKS